MVVWFSWLCVLLFLTPSNSSQSPPYSPSNAQPHHSLCHPYESSALLGFKNSILTINDTNCPSENPNTTVSWDLSKDCCSWSGVTCDELTGHVVGLHLHCSGLQGVIDSNNSLFSLTHLQTLSLSNNHFHGSVISPNFGRFVGMIHLDLSYSGFTTDLPHLFRDLKYLNELYVRKCSFIGKFPALLGNITQITSLDLSENYFSGQIPWRSLNLENLIYLDLSGNSFVGALPEICNNSTRKGFLFDPSNNQLVGSLPMKLQSLSLSGNLLNGTIPSWLFSLPSLQYLYLGDNHLTGQINQFQLNSLRGLDLSSNNFSGIFKMEQFSKLINLQYISLSFNRLSLVFKSWTDYTLPNTLRLLYLFSCNISEFPYHLRSLENLYSLDLSNNRIEGTVPQWLGNVGKDSFDYLNLSHNFLTRVNQIPWKIIEFIDLRSNQLQGHLPIQKTQKTENRV